MAAAGSLGCGVFVGGPGPARASRTCRRSPPWSAARCSRGGAADQARSSMRWAPASPCAHMAYELGRRSHRRVAQRRSASSSSNPAPLGRRPAPCAARAICPGSTDRPAGHRRRCLGPVPLLCGEGELPGWMRPVRADGCDRAGYEPFGDIEASSNASPRPPGSPDRECRRVCGLFRPRTPYARSDAAERTEVPVSTITHPGQLQQTIEGNDIVLVDWWAEWCGPCTCSDRSSRPPPKATTTSCSARLIRAEQLAAMARIQSIPMLMIFREGVLLFAQPGALPAAALEDLIGQVRNVDMEDVHRQIAEQDAGEASS
ncbi:MAG: thioredoxin domain-containing protein [Acidimicrobiales bacterium]